jgi:tyrosine decarboxylase / aspartate 1-decarboxylase
LTALAPQLDIVIWAPRDFTASRISEASRKMFEQTAAAGLHLALADLPEDLLRSYWPDVEFDQPTVTCLRSCLMKPEHLDWIDRIWDILQ